MTTLQLGSSYLWVGLSWAMPMVPGIKLGTRIPGPLGPRGRVRFILFTFLFIFCYYDGHIFFPGYYDDYIFFAIFDIYDVYRL